MNVDWIIYYDDGSSFSSDDGETWDAPRTGVEVVVQRNEQTGYDFLCTIGDYFVYDKDRGGWRITDFWGTLDHCVSCRNPLVLFGRNMSDEEFQKLKTRVRRECGPKSGWLRREQKPPQ